MNTETRTEHPAGPGYDGWTIIKTPGTIRVGKTVRRAVLTTRITAGQATPERLMVEDANGNSRPNRRYADFIPDGPGNGRGPTA